MDPLLLGLLVVLGLFVVCVVLPPLWFRRRDRRARRRGEGENYASDRREESPTRHPRAPDFSAHPCGRNEPHDKPSWPRQITVRGKSIGVAAADVCPNCLEAFFAAHATTCAACDGPILPGMPVGQAWVGAPHPFTHLDFECTASGGLYCGVWGQGRLITLHELEPDTYPPGTPNVMAHVMATGQPTITRLK
jgi:hypothetical protein